MANRQIPLVVPAGAGPGASVRISAIERSSRVIEWSGGAGGDDTFLEISNDNVNWTRSNRMYSTQGWQSVNTSGLFARVNRNMVGAGSALVATISGAETLSVENGWQMSNRPAVATQATVTLPAIPGVRHVLTDLQAVAEAAANIFEPTIVRVLDGPAGGAGAPELWSGNLTAAATAMSQLNEHFWPQPIVGTIGADMTIEFAAAGALLSQETISGQGYDIP